MKVKELIEVLKTLDPEVNVYVRGYESGVNDVSEVETIDVLRDVNKEYYYGQHQDLYNESGEKGYKLVGVNLLSVAD